MRADSWLCATCKRESSESTLTWTASEKYRAGYCLTCRSRTIHRQPTGEELRDAGMAEAASAEDRSQPEWRTEALRAVELLIGAGQPFTANDVTERAGLPLHRNAVGALLSGLARKGRIRRVGYENGDRPSQHSRVVAIWEGA